MRKRETGFEEMKKELESLGADIVVTDEEMADRSMREKIMEITNGGREQIKLGLNCVGGKLVNNMAKQLSEGAHIVTYGAMSKQPVTLPTPLLIFKTSASTASGSASGAKTTLKRRRSALMKSLI